MNFNIIHNSVTNQVRQESEEKEKTHGNRPMGLYIFKL